MTAVDGSLLAPAAAEWRERMRAALAAEADPGQIAVLDQQVVEIVSRLAEYGIDLRDDTTRDQIFLAVMYLVTLMHSVEAQGLGYGPIATVRTVAFALASLGPGR